MPYANWLTQNEGDIYQAAGYSPMASQMQAQPTPVVAAPPPPAQPPAQTQPPQQDVWTQLGQMAASGGGGQQPAPALRSSAFTTQVAPDEPNVTRSPPMGARKNKIMEIVGAIMSWGATKALSQAQQNAQAGG